LIDDTSYVNFSDEGVQPVEDIKKKLGVVRGPGVAHAYPDPAVVEDLGRGISGDIPGDRHDEYAHDKDRYGLVPDFSHVICLFWHVMRVYHRYLRQFEGIPIKKIDVDVDNAQAVDISEKSGLFPPLFQRGEPISLHRLRISPDFIGFVFAKRDF
jgi:hypothetical protein